jgi:nucleotidyltransferase substrate binding protein (TIGR01987 family)
VVAVDASLKPSQDALNNLKAALSILNPSDLERDGTIQRFEYCYELIWKLAQRILKDNEVVTDTPKSVFRELGRLGWIFNVEAWIEFQKIRNETSHEYGLKLAQRSYSLAKIFLPLAEDLFAVLKEKSQK